ncbi:MAG: MG2 domain-containing protein [Spirochaetota bacterium]
MKLILRSIFTVIFLLIISYVFTEDNPRVEFFSPQGMVKGIRQVTARFTEQMVPFGDPRAMVSPFETECASKGTGRWADQKNWVFDFDNDLPAGIECTFKLRPGIKTLSGKEIMGQREFSFSTGGPSVKRSSPYEGSYYISEEQIFILTLDAEPDADSVVKNVYFSVEGIQDHIGVKIIDGKDRSEILKSQYRHRRQQASVILLQCRQNFPSGAKVSLVWSRNVKSKTGVAGIKDQVLRYRTREAFSAGFSCERENADADCIPMLPMHLTFSAPVPRDNAKKIVLKSSSGKTWKPALPEDDSDKNSVTSVYFKGPFPPNAVYKIEVPGNLKDDNGRPLVNADKFPLEVRTGTYPPLAKFAARFGILEMKADPVLPVTLRNLEPEVKGQMLRVGTGKGASGSITGKIFNVGSEEGNIQDWLRRVGAAERESSVFVNDKTAKDFKLPKPLGAEAFEVVGIPIKEPGLYIVELESEILGASLLGKQAPMYVPTAVLVTNMSVHFKWGRESSLIWVTSLDKGEPVKDAEVAVKDCSEKILWQGKTDANGIARIDSTLPSQGSLPNCKYNSIGSGLFITAKLAGDMSFVFSSWDNGIEAWRFNLPHEYYREPAIAHTIFDRTLLRAGETVHMKHIMRNHTMKGFWYVQANKMPDTLSIVHTGSDEKYELPLKWETNDIAHSSFTIPKDAKLGYYTCVFRKSSDKDRSYYYNELTGGGFRVEEFRVPLLKGTIKPPAEPLVNADSLPLDISVRYLAGGGAGSLPVKIRSEVRRKYVSSFEGFDDFVFANGEVKEGITRGGQYMGDEEDSEQPVEERTAGKPAAMEVNLDRTGGARVEIPKLPKAETPQEILAEIEFKDPNGELQTVSSTTPLWSSGYLIGVKPDSWALSMDKFKFHTAVLDINGKPVANAKVSAQLYMKKNYTHRKRLVGGFYAYEYITEVKKISDLCKGKTDSKGLYICEVSVPASGNVIIQAEAEDKDGNRTVTNHEIWVAGKGDWWFEVSDNDRIDLLPERKKYEPGETAVFQLRMPFREATALVAVEREGIIESWVTKISGTKPVIEVPVKGTYAPNCFVSALVVRGRVTDVQPTAMVDMGRPAYKLGIAEIRVGWKAHELKVSVTPDRKVYNIRGKAEVNIKVKTSDGKIPPLGTEVALAAVDEGLLELMPNHSWDILTAMMGRRPYEISTSTAQMQVIGRRHFGLKALPQGGGGGRETTRELFDTLLLWKGKVVLDKNGEAKATIPLNDSITSFRIVAVATGGSGLFGSGAASIQSTQELMILAGLPPLVREGDKYRAEFTLRNTTGRAMNITASVQAEGIADALKPVTALLQPGEAKEIGWDATVPFGIEKLAWTAQVMEKETGKSDSIKIHQKVVPAVPVRTYQATIMQVENSFRMTVERPADAVPGRGGIRVSLKPKLSQGQTGITEYMKSYPYTCMEQRVSIAVSLRDKSLWEKAMSDINSYMDSDGLVKYFPTCLYGSPALTSYILAIGNEAGWEMTTDTETTIINALTKFIEGKIVRYSPIETADLAIKKLSAIEAISRTGLAKAKLLGSISIDPNLWPTSAVIDWFNILQNIKDIQNRKDKIKEAEHILRSRLNFQGTRMGFSTEGTDCLWWLMVSNDVNSVRLVLSLVNADMWKEDMPRIVLGALSRQHQGRWDLTLANAWGVLAMEKFSKKFESVPVTGDTSASLAGQAQNTVWKAAPVGKESFFSWPAKKDELGIFHKGTGKPWATVRSLAAIPLKEPLSSGYKIKKTIIPVEQKVKDKWTTGDIYRIRLDVEAQADQTWVVVSDPVPAGVTILGKGLARDSQILTKDEERKGRVWPAFEERSFEAFRAYYEYVPKGKWTVEYTIRINQGGLFQLPTTRVEALYFPEMFGEIPNRAIEVGR